jgi:acyl-coenzyme A thioesterase PaaI-like protein
MSFYQKITALGKRFVSYNTLFKYGFNWSPMYRRTTAKVLRVSPDLSEITVKLPINWKNKNYVGTIFGGSMFSAVDPIPMVQLINLLGANYVVWDKSAEIQFKRPAHVDLFAHFLFKEEELAHIKKQVAQKKEIEIVKTTILTDKQREKEFCIVNKTIYIADKVFYKEKRRRKNQLMK